MEKRIELTTIPAGSTIRVGAPAERPQEAIEALLALFAQNESVLSARLGLMEIQYPDGRTNFTYTIGIECSGDDASIIREALEAISDVPDARWPVSVVPPITPYFSEEAIVFYEQSTNRKKTFAKLMRRVGF
ncbi:MAG TPA: enhanced serine sensitivity protein SseB C-terminal domain-containing protein [Pyrinomonadaceae bacterium]|nr:enhanced serine sensitivity protein SseB C-terminal domain-containing protein [Pyrinomonadaceae bacterium]